VTRIGYTFDGDTYCPGCVPKASATRCECGQVDDLGVCVSNCHGYGPNPFTSIEASAHGAVCGGCLGIILEDTCDGCEECANVADLDTFTTAYVECALWSSTTDDGTPLDDEHGPEDIARHTLKRMIRDCRAFQNANANDIESDRGRAGHDFWLTRNRHGAGFWDRSRWPDDAGARLTDAAHAFGECDLYVSDAGKIEA
jgi:hypothetical protein